MQLRDRWQEVEQKRLRFGWGWILLIGTFWYTGHNTLGAAIAVAIYFTLRQFVFNTRIESVWKRSLASGMIAFSAVFLVNYLLK